MGIQLAHFNKGFFLFCMRRETPPIKETNKFAIALGALFLLALVLVAAIGFSSMGIGASNDNNAARVDPMAAPQGVTSFPEVKGMKKEEAKAFVLEKNPNLNVQYVPEGSMVTRDYVTNRVRLFLDADDNVQSEAQIG